jgi:hypothetical protein
VSSTRRATATAAAAGWGGPGSYFSIAPAGPSRASPSAAARSTGRLRLLKSEEVKALGVRVCPLAHNAQLDWRLYFLIK